MSLIPKIVRPSSNPLDKIHAFTVFPRITRPVAGSALSVARTTHPTRLRSAVARCEEARNMPASTWLWGDFWEQSGIAIFAGEPGAAKSLLAVIIAHAVSSTTSTLLGLPTPANEKVLYYDFELTDRQFEKRHGDLPFTDNLIVGDFNPEGYDVEFAFQHIAADLEKTGAKLLIIDNITALSMKTTTDADAALSIMRGLKSLQKLHGVSSLVIAHPPKLPAGVPLSLNHIGGSKHLTNFADSVFFIARSAQGPNLRYLKQVKNRTSEQLPGVLVCEILETSEGLGFALVGPDEERNHLAQAEGGHEKPEGDSSTKINELRALWERDPTTAQYRLAEQLGMSSGWVNKHLKRFREAAAVHIHAIHEGVNVNALKENNTDNQDIHAFTHSHSPQTVNAVNVNEATAPSKWTTEQVDCLFIHGSTATTAQLLTELEAYHADKGPAAYELTELQRLRYIERAPSGPNSWRITRSII